MNDFLQQHKRFVVGYVIGFFAFLIAWLIVGAVFGGDTGLKNRQIARYKREIRSEPRGINVRALRLDREAQANSLMAMASALGRNSGDFTIEGKGEPDLHYNAMVERLLGPGRLEDLAIADIDFDESLGRPDKYPSTAESFEWYLRGLDVVDQLMQWILEIEQEKASAVIARVEQVSIAPPPKRSGRRSTGPQFVTQHAVDVTIVGHPIGISALMKKLASSDGNGRFIALDEARIESLDEMKGQRKTRRGRGRVDPLDRGRVRARFRLITLDIRESLLAAEAES